MSDGVGEVIMVVASETPVSIGKVTLTVRDLDGVGDFYQRVIGLHRHGGDPDHLLLGNGQSLLLELRRDKAARQSTRREAGLFHTAFLLPSRAHLGAWLHHFAGLGLRLDGAADHVVSEAVYLHDPEGNGIEVYRDRSGDAWTWENGQVAMRNDPLDFDGILASGQSSAWAGAPVGASVGHVHLQVGDLPPAEAFYTQVLGLEVTCRFPGATFYASGGYHHHLATNVWNSRGAAPRSFPSTGLQEVELLSKGGVPSGTPDGLVDAWGTRFVFRVV